MKKSKQRVKGTISAFFEHGCGGIHELVFDRDGKEHWERRIHLLEAGDYLVIYNEDDSVAFQGKIKPNYKSHDMQTSWMQASWTQKGWKPDKWAKLFFHKPPLRAILRKK